MDSEEEFEAAEFAECAAIERRQFGAIPNGRPQDQLRRKIGETAYQRQVCRPNIQQTLALQLYACGELTKKEMGARLNIGDARTNTLIESRAGQDIIARVRGDLEFRFQAMFKKTLDVIEDGLNHPEPSIALASANMWLKNARAQKIEVKITAEDLIGKIMNGEL